MADDQPTTVTGLAGDLGRSLIAALPPAFLMLCVVNLAFLAVVLWFLDHLQEQRTAMVGKLVDRCMEIALEHPPPSARPNP
jgi:hypothetical protein